MTKKILISAYNIHAGGGAVLLKDLLATLEQLPEVAVTCYCDQRIIATLPESLFNSSVELKSVPASAWSRLLAEKEIAQASGDHHSMLCFGNLPPLFTPKCPVFVFVQNKYLIGDRWLNSHTCTSVIRSLVERLWFKLKRNPSYQYVVQTQSMASTLSDFLGKGFKIQIRPFVGSSHLPKKSVGTGEQNFIYVASGEPHKNHQNLIEAWILLKQAGANPRLTLILDPQQAPKLAKWIEQKIHEHGLSVQILGSKTRDELLRLYPNYQALIFPSYYESFGLPLAEAQAIGLHILAPELDYVRDLVDPIQSFDANSPLSIQRAVLRYLGLPQPKQQILSPEQFINYLSEV